MALIANLAMVLDSVDDQDRVRGQVRRSDVFDVRSNFRVVHGFVRNHREQVLLQKLASSHPRHPGRWGSSVAGFVAAGESYGEAIARKSEEELGQQLTWTAAGKFVMPDQGVHKFIRLYTAEAVGPFEAHHPDVELLAWMPETTLRSTAISKPESFTPTFLFLLKAMR